MQAIETSQTDQARGVRSDELLLGWTTPKKYPKKNRAFDKGVRPKEYPLLVSTIEKQDQNKNPQWPAFALLEPELAQDHRDQRLDGLAPPLERSTRMERLDDLSVADICCSEPNTSAGNQVATKEEQVAITSRDLVQCSHNAVFWPTRQIKTTVAKCELHLTKGAHSSIKVVM